MVNAKKRYGFFLAGCLAVLLGLGAIASSALGVQTFVSVKAANWNELYSTPWYNKYAATTTGDDNYNNTTVFEISNANELAAFAYVLNNVAGRNFEGKTVVLTKDIDLKDNFWTPIGNGSQGSKSFNGTFDGQGFTIKNLNIDVTSGNYHAFFGYCDGAKVVFRNFTLDTGLVKFYLSSTSGSNTYYGGVLVAYNNSTSLNFENIVSSVRCETILNQGGTSTSKMNAGGLLGFNNTGTKEVSITNCENNGAVRAEGYNAYAGGFIGSASSGTSTKITGSKNSGSIKTNSGGVSAAGGFVAAGKAAILDSENSGDVECVGNNTCSPYAGGFVGNGSNSIIRNCVNSGNISAVRPEAGYWEQFAYCGGFVGMGNNHTIINGMNTGSVKATSASSQPAKPPYAGGFIGVGNALKVLNCVNLGDVTATITGSNALFAGGIIGNLENYGDTPGVLRMYNSYSAADVLAVGTSSKKYRGGLIGHIGTSYYTTNVSDNNIEANIQNCFYEDRPGGLSAWGKWHDGDDKSRSVLDVGVFSEGMIFDSEPSGSMSVGKNLIDLLNTGRTSLIEEHNTENGSGGEEYYKTWAVNSEGYPVFMTPQQTITVTFNTNGGSDVASLDIPINTEDLNSYKPANPTREYHSFMGWYKDEALTELFDFTGVVPEADITLYAKWNPISFTITFVTNSEMVMGPVVVYPYSNMADFAANIPAKTGHTFEGWYKNESLTEKFVFNEEAVVESDMTLYANWTKKTYTINYNFNDGTQTEATDSVTFGEEFNLIIPEYEHHVFDGWYSADGTKQYTDKEGNGVTVWDDDPDNGAIELRARWTTKTYTIIFDVNGGEGSVPSVQGKWNELIPEEKIPQKPSKLYHSFVGWFTIDNTEFDFETMPMPAGGITLHAKWAELSSRISFVTNSNDDNIEAVTLYPNSPTPVIRTPYKKGYDFAGWFTEKELENPFDIETDIILGKDFTLFASWTPRVYKVTYDFDGGSHKDASGTAKWGLPFTFIVPSRDHYYFVGWFSTDGLNRRLTTSLGGSNGEPWLEDPSSGETVVIARWDKVLYDIRFDIGSGGTWKTISYLYDELIPVEKIPYNPVKEFATFGGWYTAQGVQFDFETMKMPAGGTNLFAKWNADTTSLDFLVQELNGYLTLSGLKPDAFENFSGAMENAMKILEDSSSTIESIKAAHEELWAAAIALSVVNQDTNTIIPPSQYRPQSERNDNTWLYVIISIGITLAGVGSLLAWRSFNRKEQG